MKERDLLERASRFYPDMETLAAFTADLINELAKARKWKMKLNGFRKATGNEVVIN